MSFNPPKKPDINITPRQLLCLNRLGTGTDVNAAEYRDFLFVHGTGIARAMRHTIKQLTGFSPSELHSLAPETHLSTNPEAKATRKQIKIQVLKNLPFLEKYRDQDKEGGLRSLSRRADDYIRNLITQYFPGEEDVHMADEVANCSDVETLILLAFHDGVDAKVKFEASRKLLLMKFFGEISSYSKKQVDHDKALNFMDDFFNRRINKLAAGAKLGHGVDRYLITTHAEEDYRTLAYEIGDTKPKDQELKPNMRVTPLRCRMTVVKNQDGKERVIFFRKHPREKDPEAQLTKDLRYDSMVGEKDRDRNGIRLVFDNEEDWKDFFRMFQEELKNDIRQELEDLDKTETDPERKETYALRLGDLDKSVKIEEHKNSLDGSKFKGSAPSSCSELKIHKFKLRIVRADGRIHEYEFQIFLPDGYADYLYRTEVSWEEYNARRFFESNLDEIFFPERIYRIDRQKLRAKVKKIARQKTRNGNGNGYSHPAPIPEGTPDENIEKNQ